MIEFIGTIVLTPESDSWTRTIVTESTNVRTVVGRPLVLAAGTRIPRRNARPRRRGWFRRLLFGRRRARPRGIRAGGLEIFQEDLVGNRVLANSFIETIQGPITPDTHIRSRNVAFNASNLRPLQRHYAFFDNTSGIDIVPKLLEISMVNGIFQKGETVEAYDSTGEQVAIFRIAQPDHKLGDINSPEETFNANPYNTSVALGSVYSASTSVLNIDILSLADEVQGRFLDIFQQVV